MPHSPDEKKRAITRLRRIRGQVDGLERAIEDGLVHDAASSERWIADLLAHAVEPVAVGLPSLGSSAELEAALRARYQPTCSCVNQP